MKINLRKLGLCGALTMLVALLGSPDGGQLTTQYLFGMIGWVFVALYACSDKEKTQE